MKFVIQIIFAIRTGLLKIAGKVFEKMRDPDTGKMKLGSPDQVRKVMVTGFIVFIVGIALYQIFNSTFNPIDGTKDFTSELDGKLNITAQEIPYNRDIQGDPLARIRGGDGSGGRGGLSLDGDSINPDSRECLALLNKLKAGEQLGQVEKRRLKYCLENNITGLSPEELALAKKLLDSSILSAEEKRLYNELFAAEPECKDTFEKQIVTAKGNRFVSNVLNNQELNDKVIALLKDQPKLRQAIITPNGLKTALGVSDDEVEVFKLLLENCSPDLLITMLTDPKMREILNKLLAEALNNPNFINDILSGESLSPMEEDLLRSFLQGQIGIDNPDYAVAQALLSTDPMRRGMARDLLNARELGLGELADALTRKLNNENVEIPFYDADALKKAAEARRAGDGDLANVLTKMALGQEVSDEDKKILGLMDEFGNVATGIDKEALARALADDIARRQAEMDALMEALARAQAEAREAAERLAQGLPLTAEQQEALQRFADLQRQLAELQKRLQDQKDRLAALITGMQSTIDQIGIDIQTLYPSGMSVDMADWTKCKDIKPLILVKKPKQTKAIARKKGMLGPDGKELSPDQTRIIQLMRKQKADELAEKARIERELLNAGQTLAGQTASLNSLLAQGGANQGGIQALIISENNDLRPFQLAPDILVPGLMLTQILVTDKGSNQKVRVKILADVYDLTGKIVIPRNSIAFGSTSSFDVDTGVMNVNLDTVSVGGKVVDVGFSMGSADLSPGLKGEVRDTRGKLLLGAFITSFTSGAIGALSQNYIAPFQQSELVSDSLTGAALQGTAAIAQRIASLYAGDLQNAARVFYAPANIRVILSPNN